MDTKRMRMPTTFDEALETLSATDGDTSNLPTEVATRIEQLVMLKQHIEHATTPTALGDGGVARWIHVIDRLHCSVLGQLVDLERRLEELTLHVNTGVEFTWPERRAVEAWEVRVVAGRVYGNAPYPVDLPLADLLERMKPIDPLLEWRKLSRYITRHAVQRTCERSPRRVVNDLSPGPMIDAIDMAVENAHQEGKTRRVDDYGEPITLADMAPRFEGLWAVVKRNVVKGHQKEVVVTVVTQLMVETNTWWTELPAAEVAP